MEYKALEAVKEGRGAVRDGEPRATWADKYDSHSCHCGNKLLEMRPARKPGLHTGDIIWRGKQTSKELTIRQVMDAMTEIYRAKR